MIQTWSFALCPPSRARTLPQDSGSQQSVGGEVPSAHTAIMWCLSPPAKVTKAEVKGLLISRARAQSSETK